MQFVRQLEDAVGAGGADVDANNVLIAVECFLESGFVGNRSVSDTWGLIRRTSRAYTLSLNDLLERVLDSSRGHGLDRQQLQQKWIRQAVFEGKLATFISKVPEQPHIKSAYQTDAHILQADVAQQWGAVIAKLQHHQAFADTSMEDSLKPTPSDTAALSAEIQMNGSQPELGRNDTSDEVRVHVQIILEDVGTDSSGDPFHSHVRVKLQLSVTEASCHLSSSLSGAAAAAQVSTETTGQSGTPPSSASSKGDNQTESAEKDANPAPKPARPAPHPVLSWGRGLFMHVMAQRHAASPGDKERASTASQGNSDATPDSVGKSVGTASPDKRDKDVANNKIQHRALQQSDTHEPTDGDQNSATRGTSDNNHPSEKDSESASEVLDKDKNGKPADASESVSQGEPQSSSDAAVTSTGTPDTSVGTRDSGTDAHDRGTDARDRGTDARDMSMDARDHGTDARDRSMDTRDSGTDARDGGTGARDGGMDAHDGGQSPNVEKEKPVAAAHSAANRWLGSLFRRTHAPKAGKKEEGKGDDKDGADGASSTGEVRLEESPSTEKVAEQDVMSTAVIVQQGKEEDHAVEDNKPEASGPPPPPFAAAGRILSNITRRSPDNTGESRLLRLTIRVLDDSEPGAKSSTPRTSEGDGDTTDGRLVEVSIKLVEDHRLEHQVRAWSQAAAQAAVGAAGVIAQQAAHKAPILWQYIREHAEQHLMIVPPHAPNRGNDAQNDSNAGAAVEQIPVQDTPEYKDGVKEAEELSRELQRSVEELLEAESSSKFVLGDECAALIALCHMVEKVLHHGLRQEFQWTQQWIKSQPLLSWIPTPHPHPFAMLGELQKGRRQGRNQAGNQNKPDAAPSDPPVDLGVDAIHGMRMAAGVSESTKLQLWIRVSLNQQLLGRRMQLLFDYTHRRGKWQATQEPEGGTDAGGNGARASMGERAGGNGPRASMGERAGGNGPRASMGERAGGNGARASMGERAGGNGPRASMDERAGSQQVQNAAYEGLSGAALDAWFQPWALLRLEQQMEEATEKLAKVDGVRSLLAVDVQSVRPPAIKATQGEDSTDTVSGAQFDWPISPTSTLSEADSAAAIAAPAVILPRVPSLSRSSKGREKRVVEIQTATGGREQAFSPRSSAGVLSPVSSSEFHMDMFEQLAADIERADSAEWTDLPAQPSDPPTSTTGLKLPSLDLLSVLQPKAAINLQRSPRKKPAADKSSPLGSASFDYSSVSAKRPANLDESPASQRPLTPTTLTPGDSSSPSISQDTGTPPVPEPLPSSSPSPESKKQREAVDAVLARLKDQLPLEGVALVPEVLEGKPVTKDDRNPLMDTGGVADSAAAATVEPEGEEIRGEEEASKAFSTSPPLRSHAAPIPATASLLPETKASSSPVAPQPDQHPVPNSRPQQQSPQTPASTVPSSMAHSSPQQQATQASVTTYTSGIAQPPHAHATVSAAPSSIAEAPVSQASVTTARSSLTPPPPTQASATTHCISITPTPHSQPSATTAPSSVTPPPPPKASVTTPRTTTDSLPDSTSTSRRSTMSDVSADGAPHAGRAGAHRRMSSGGGYNVGSLNQQVVSLSVVASHTLQDSKGSEFTVYDVRVELQDGAKYQVQHRFSDFVNLRHSLKYTVGAALPESWGDISKARHVTGRARISNEVVHARQAMLDRCLRDLMQTSPALINIRLFRQFLAPQSGDIMVQPQHPLTNQATSATAPVSSSSAAPRTQQARSTIRLQFDLSHGASPSEQFKAQQGNCASCRCPLPPLEDSYSLWRQNSSRGPRVCHYTHMLYCHDCHEGHMHIIPARILHKWDFSRHPVCVAVHEYLQAVFNQPMISVTAINPGLYARVPTMAKAYELRHKTVLALDRARSAGPEAAAKVQKLLEVAGHRAYLLEKADFWSLRDLQDMSKGAFSEIPQWLEAAAQRATAIATAAVLANKTSGK